MKCIACESWSFSLICKQCQQNLLNPNFYTRNLDDGLKVYSFYGFEEIKKLLESKYEFFGDRVFAILAQLSFQKFAQEFTFESNVVAIGIDDAPRHGFSQSALLAKALKSRCIKPEYATLRATNIVKYAGKDLEFRQKNPRKFLYSGKKGVQVVLVDDIITTGTTMLEAKNTLHSNDCEVLFGLCLADAKI